MITWGGMIGHSRLLSYILYPPDKSFWTCLVDLTTEPRLQYRCPALSCAKVSPAVYMYTCTINKGGLSAIDLVYGWKVKAMFSLGSNTINPIISIETTPVATKNPLVILC